MATKNIALSRAIEHAGNISALARLLDVDRQVIQHWVRAGRVPAERVVALEAATGGLVRREDLRPDLFRPSI